MLKNYSSKSFQEQVIVRACVLFFRKRAKKAKKGKNILKFGQICTKFENNLKKGSLKRLTITCMKQLKYALQV